VANAWHYEAASNAWDAEYYYPMFAVSVSQSVSLSVCHAAHLGFTVQRWLNRSRCCFRRTLLEPMKHCVICVRRGSWFPHKNGRGSTFKFCDKISPERLKLETKFCVHTEGWGVNENYAKVGHKESRTESRDPLLSSLTASISQERLQLASLARAVCAVHLLQPLPNYFGLLFHYLITP